MEINNLSDKEFKIMLRPSPNCVEEQMNRVRTSTKRWKI